MNLFGGEGRGGEGRRGEERGGERRRGEGREGGREGGRDDCYTYSNRYVQSQSNDTTILK